MIQAPIPASRFTGLDVRAVPGYTHATAVFVNLTATATWTSEPTLAQMQPFAIPPEH